MKTRLRAAVTLALRWYVLGTVLAGLGVLTGFLVFFYAFPREPEIGLIDVPGSSLTRRAAARFGQMLDFARDKDSIKAVVIKLDSPGGSATASEKLFLKTLELRETKPVVIVVEGMAASGAYLWSMGSNFIYVTPSSQVGNVGAIVSVPRPLTPDEDRIFSGPSKQTGATRRTITAGLEMVKEAFVETVLSQRAERLRLTREELEQARIYLGMEAVRLGLADGIGSDSDGIAKAARLAGISNYGLVDINAEVDRINIEKNRRIFESLFPPEDIENPAAWVELLQALLPNLDQTTEGEASLPSVPSDITLPRFDYLYVVPPE